jgi:hypothetical protein
MRSDRDPLPLPEIDAKDFTREKIVALSNNFAFPVVIRGGLKDTPALKLWADEKWWLENYGDEEVITKPVGRSYGGNSKFFASIKEWAELAEVDGRSNYIAGASSIFRRRPELAEMVDSPLLRQCSPNAGEDPINLQLFMGFSGSGSPIHSGFGCNLFRMIVGRKRWWFMPTTETPYMMPSMTSTGFSMHSTLRMAPIGGNITDPIVPKMERYTAVLEPGDLLINPPWIWHAIENIDNFTVGVPSRYPGPAAFRTDPIATIMAGMRFISNYGSIENFRKSLGGKGALHNGRDALEQGIADNRASENYEKSSKNKHFD